jgi:hypothetical protein
VKTKPAAVKEPPKKKYVVNISPEVWQYIVKHGHFTETPNDVLKRLFGLDEAKDQE